MLLFHTMIERQRLSIQTICGFLSVALLFLLSGGNAAGQNGDVSADGASTGGTSVVQSGSKFVIARVKYEGGGDWYNDPSSELNMLRFLRQQTDIDVDVRTEQYVEVGSEKLFSYPFVFMTGHGSISLTDREAQNLRTYLENGGFLYVDDDYGFDKAFRREMKKVFPEKELVELPFSHGIYHVHYDFPNGLPKIHEHDKKPPQGFGIFHEGRLVVFYTYESNLADGWADPDIHKDPEEVRQKALRMGLNIIVWALTQ